jgi:spermidine synthase
MTGSNRGEERVSDGWGSSSAARARPDGLAAILEGGKPSRGFVVLSLCFFLSGATGLIYQVVWLRLLALVIGHTVYAITTVLVAVMSGLAVGSFVFARLARRLRSPVATYGWLEIGIGLYGALIPWLLALAGLVYLHLFRTLSLSHSGFDAVQFIVLLLLLLIPTTLMGGTLPVLSQALVRGEGRIGRTVGALYAVNTCGAVFGVAVGGYVLLPTLGNRRTIGLAAFANLAVGLLALAYARRLGEARVGAAPRLPGTPSPSLGRPVLARPRVEIWLTVAALAFSGMASMVYEVAWTRALTLVIGSSTYAFTAMLLAFLIGIAGGSALYSWGWGARRASSMEFAVIQAALGAVVALTVAGFERVPELSLGALRWSASPGGVQIMQVAVSAAALLPSTLLIGATFPCAVAVVVRGRDDVGEDVGHVYAANTLGAIGGTVLAGFALIPAIGVQGSLRFAVGVNLLVAAVLFAIPARPLAARRLAGMGATVLVGVGVLLVPRWDSRVMSSGPAIYGLHYLRRAGAARLLQVLRQQEVVYYRDGVSGTVSVSRSGEHVFLRINGKTEAGTAGDMSTQLLLAHLPLLIHAAPASVLIVGLGSGITAGAAARHPVARVDVVEIEPAVIEAARFFAHVHGDVLSDPRVRTIVADGRHFLLTSPARYDVIISEPSNPWIGGLASLFSVEFFQLARDRLHPAGFMVQWLQGYGLLPDDFRMVVNTFRSVFPATTLWQTNRGDFLLIGAQEERPLDLRRLRGRIEAMPAIREDLARLGVDHWAGLLGFFMLRSDAVARLGEGAGLNTDDRLPLEFRAPRGLYVETTETNIAQVRRARSAELPDVVTGQGGELAGASARHAIGRSYLRRRLPEDALAHFRTALAQDPTHAPSLLGAAEAEVRLRHPQTALDLARQVLAREPANAEAFFLAGVAHAVLQARDEALAALERAVALRPQHAGYRAVLDQLRRGGAEPPVVQDEGAESGS